MTESNEDKIYFAVTVTRRRAEYLAKCLETALCRSCGRELDECEADPCDSPTPTGGVIPDWRRWAPPQI